MYSPPKKMYNGMMHTQHATKRCVIQCRVSSLKQSHDGESLENQEASLRRFVAQRGWTIVPEGKVWSTAISGRKTDREDFEDILKYIKAHPGKVDCYVFKAIDRFTRAGSGEYERMKAELAQCSVEMVDMYGVIQTSKNTLEEYGFSYDWSTYSPSEITENIMATNAKQEVTTILTRMIGQEIKLTNEGYKMRRPLDGFLNQKVYIDGKKKPIQVPDPERAKFYVAMFELRARGLTDREIVEKVNAMGFKTLVMNRWDKAHRTIIGRTGGLPLSIQQLQRAIKNPGYAGIVCEKWTNYRPIKGKSPGIVTIQLFNEANQGKVAIVRAADGGLELRRGGVSEAGVMKRLKDNPLFPYKVFRCPVCHGEFLGSSPKGKSGKVFATYHCARKHKYFGINKKAFEENVQTFIRNLNFRPELPQAIEFSFLKEYQAREKEIARAADHIRQNVAGLQSEQGLKLEALVATRSAVVRERLEKEYEELEEKINSARHSRFEMGIGAADIRAFRGLMEKIVEHPAEMLLGPMDISLRREMLGLVFERIPNYQEILNGTPKLAFVFDPFSESSVVDNHYVSPQALGWNTIKEIVLRWKEAGERIRRNEMLMSISKWEDATPSQLRESG